MQENLNKAVSRVLISEEDIAKRIKELGKEISKDYKGTDKDIVFVGILKGSFIFMADLVKEVDLPIKVDFMSVSSYGNSTISVGDVRILKDLEYNITGKHIIIIEDIVDTGYTLSYLKENLSSRGAESVKCCSLLNKEERRVTDAKVEYVGFEVPNEFVIGYGMDYAEKYRNLPFIGVINEDYIIN